MAGRRDHDRVLSMRIHPLVPAVVLFAALAAVLAFATGGGDPSPPLAGPGGTATTAPAAPAAEIARGAAPAATGADGEVEGAGADPAERSEVIATGAAPPPGPRLTVVRGEPPRPVPGIAVWWIDRDAGRLRRQREAQRSDLAWLSDFDLPHRYGVSASTDAAGHLSLPPLRGETMVAVVDDEHGEFAAAPVQPDQGELLLRLRADETVQVAVRDALRTPRADVPVALFQGKKWGDTNSIWQGRSGRDGRALARHFQLLRAGKDQGERFAAAIAVPLRVPVAVEFEGRPAPKEPIELLLPPTGRVEVAVVHAGGAPLLSEATVVLGAPRPEGFALPLPLHQRFDWARAQKALGSEPAVFPHLELGADVQPLLRLPNDRKPALLAPIRLPADATATLALTLALPPDVCVLAATALGADGAPLASASLDFALLPGRGDSSGGSASTLPDGRFDIPWRNRDPSQTWSLELRTVDLRGAILTAQQPAFVLAPGERRDFGALRLSPATLLAAGAVRDDQGTPVAAASVSLQRYGTNKRGEAWLDVPLTAAATADDGAFALLGTVPSGALRVCVRKDGHLPFQSDPIQVGMRLDVQLIRVGRLRGRVLLPDWVPPGSASLQLVSSYEPRREQRQSLPRRNAEFQMQGLSGGIYDARILLRNLPQPLCELPGLRIEPGENRDQRLDPLDLRANLFRYRLRAVGPGGAELAGFDGPIVWTPQLLDGSKPAVGFRWQHGRAELITQAPSIELVTVGMGYLPTRLALPAGDSDVFLQPVQPVVVELPGVRALCGPERAIRVSLILNKDSGLPQGLSGIDQRNGEPFSFPRWFLGKSGGGWLDADDRAEAIVSQNGQHEVVLRLYLDRRRDGPQTSLTIGTVDAVVDGPLPRVHRLLIDPAKVQQALLALDRQVRDSNARASR